MICLICMPSALGPVALGLWAYISALSPQACGPRALGIHIRQIARAYVTTITCTFKRDCMIVINENECDSCCFELAV